MKTERWQHMTGTEIDWKSRSAILPDNSGDGGKMYKTPISLAKTFSHFLIMLYHAYFAENNAQVRQFD
jgi:hypothetical protein